MIFAAGLGTRLQPLTLHTPKALVKVGGQPMLWHVLQKLRSYGFEHIVINVHHFAEQIVDYLSANRDFGLDIHVSHERDMLLETGGGIKHAMPFFDPSSPVLIHNVDILSNADLSTLWEQTGGNGAGCDSCGDSDAGGSDAVLLVSPRQTKRYLLFNEHMCLQGWTNIETGLVKGPAASRQELTPTTPLLNTYNKLAFSGIHVISPSLLAKMSNWPERFSIIDFYLTACADSRITACQQPHLRLLDVGKLETLREAETFIGSFSQSSAQ